MRSVKRRIKLNTTQLILLSFLVVILVGSILLSLPISTQTGESVPYIDALFTATTATCVTGLVTVPTYSTWSVFGQVVILILIQIGGLGVITVLSGVEIEMIGFFGKYIPFGEWSGVITVLWIVALTNAIIADSSSPPF